MVNGFYEKTHFARVKKINNNSIKVEELNHAYSVDVDILDVNFKNIMTIKNVMVAVVSAGTDGRGLWGLPDIGQLVEIGFVGSNARFPIIRSCVPIGCENKTNDKSVVLGYNSGNKVQIKDKNILIDAEKNIIELKDAVQTLKTDKFFIGKDENLLAIISVCFDSIFSALTTLASHTHTETLSITSAPVEGADVSSSASTLTAENSKIKNITA